MRRIGVFLLLMMFGISISAQTQQGIVKTRGRMVNGKLVPGIRLSGATITLNFGNPLVSGNQGAFSFAIPTAKTYSLVSATKQGYTLADPEYTRRSFSYSAKSPFYVVLENENQRQADINAATRKVRRTLTAQLQKREDEIEELKAQNKLTETDYQKRLQQLYDNQSKSEQLVKEMAERYASTDYDQLDEFNQQVQMYIEEGELQKADSMIRSKGNIEERIEKYHNTVVANEEFRQQLEQSEAGTARTLLELSQDLHNRYDIFAQKFQVDSALYCLKLRAELDTTNIQNTIDYADLLLNQNHHRNAESYYVRALKLCEQNGDSTNIAYIWRHLGNLFFDIGDYYLAEQYYQKILGYRNNIISDIKGESSLNTGRIYNNLGNIYRLRKEFTKAEQAYQNAYNIEHKLYLDGALANHESEYWGLLNNFGLQYYDTKQLQKSLQYYLEAIDGLTMLCERDSSRFNLSVLAMVYDNVAKTYMMSLDFSSAEKYFNKSREIFEGLSRKNPQRYLHNLGNLYSDMGNLFNAKTDYERALSYFLLAKERFLEVYELRGDKDKNTEIPKSYENVGIAYLNLHNNELAIENLSVAISMFKDIFHAQDNKSIKSSLVYAYRALGKAQEEINDENALVSMSRSVQLCKELYVDNPIVHWENYVDVLIDRYTYSKNISKWDDKILEDAMRVIDDVKKMPNIDSTSIINSSVKIESNRSLYYYNKKDYEHTIDHALHALEYYEYLYTKAPDAYSHQLIGINLLLSSAYYLMNKPECAKAILTRTYVMSDSLYQANIHSYHSTHSLLLLKLGTIEYENKDYEAAKNYFEDLIRVIETCSNRGLIIEHVSLYDIYKLLGKTLYACEDYSGATEVYNKLFEYYTAKPTLIKEKRLDYVQLLNMLAVAHANIEGHEQQRDTFTILEWEQSRILYEQDSIEYKSLFVEMQNYAAYYFMTNEMSEKAVVLTRETYRLDRDASIGYLAGALNCRANEYLRKQEYDLALESVEEALTLQPDAAGYIDTKGEILLMQGKNAEALEMWKKVLELNPDFLQDHPEGTNLSNGLKKLGLL